MATADIPGLDTAAEKVGVWWAINAYTVIRPIFYETLINAQRYRDDILTPLFEQLTDLECQSGYFQQDSSTVHTADETLNLIKGILKVRIISKGLWPGRSSDLWGHLKNKIYAMKPHTLEELKVIIRNEIDSISEDFPPRLSRYLYFT